MRKKRKLFLHVGVEKTGTSAIQSALFENKNTLRDEYSIIYPESIIWPDKSHHILSLSLLETDLHGDVGDMYDVLGRLDEEIDSSSCRDMIISSEIFRWFYQHKNYSILEERIFKKFEVVTVMLAVRPQAEWLSSMYNQWVKDPNVHTSVSLQEYVEEMKDDADFLGIYNGWQSRIKNLSVKNEVVVVDYSDNPLNIIRKFFNIVVGGYIFWSDNILLTDNRENSALPRPEIDFIRHFNKIDISIEKRRNLNRLISEYCSNKQQRPFLKGKYRIISPELERGIYEHYKENNNDLSAKSAVTSIGKWRYVEKEYVGMEGVTIDELSHLILFLTNQLEG